MRTNDQIWNRTEWLEALRSGRYNQGKNKLHQIYENAYCCLGVACKMDRTVSIEGDVFHVNGSTAIDMPPTDWFSSRFGVPAAMSDGGRLVAYLAGGNDSGMTFKQLSDYAEYAFSAIDSGAAKIPSAELWRECWERMLEVDPSY